MNNLVEQVFGPDAVAPSKHEPVVRQRTEMEQHAKCPHQGNLLEEHRDEVVVHDVLPEAGVLVHDLAKIAIASSDFDLQEAADYITNELPKLRPDLQPECLRAGRHLAHELMRFGVSVVMISQDAVTRSLLPATEDRGEVLVVAEPDLVLATTKPESIVVLDFKTGWKERTNEESQDEFQTCVVCWTLWGKYPECRTIHFWYLNTRRNTRSYCRLERDRDEHNFEARILSVVQLIESGSDEAWPEPTKCGQCPVTRWCKLATLEAKELAKDPKAYADEVIVLEAKVSMMMEAIKAHCKNGFTIYGTGGRFDDTPKRKSPVLVSFKEDKPEKPEKKAKKKAKSKTSKKKGGDASD